MQIIARRERLYVALGGMGAICVFIFVAMACWTYRPRRPSLTGVSYTELVESKVQSHF
jgi:hypothetical protein